MQSPLYLCHGHVPVVRPDVTGMLHFKFIALTQCTLYFVHLHCSEVLEVCVCETDRESEYRCVFVLCGD